LILRNGHFAVGIRLSRIPIGCGFFIFPISGVDTAMTRPPG